MKRLRLAVEIVKALRRTDEGDWQTVYCQTDIRHRYIGSLMVLRRLLQVCFSTRIARQPDNVIRSVWELCYNWGYAFAMKYLYVFTYFVIKLRQKNNIKFTLNESILITLFERPSFVVAIFFCKEYLDLVFYVIWNVIFEIFFNIQSPRIKKIVKKWLIFGKIKILRLDRIILFYWSQFINILV